MFSFRSGALAGGLTLSLAFCAQAWGETGPLTLKASEALSDQQLVARALQQIEEQVVQVHRPQRFTLSPMPPWFSGLGLMLKAEAPRGYSGLCSAEILEFSFRTPNQETDQPPKPDTKGPQLPAVDPPVIAHEIRASTEFKIVGAVEPLEYNALDRATSNKCSDIRNTDGFFYVSDPYDVLKAAWAKDEIVRQLKLTRPLATIECSGDCRRFRDELLHASITSVNVQGETVSITVSQALPSARAGTFLRIDADVHEKPHTVGPKFDVDNFELNKVTIATMAFAVD